MPVTQQPAASQTHTQPPLHLDARLGPHSTVGGDRYGFIYLLVIYSTHPALSDDRRSKDLQTMTLYQIRQAIARIERCTTNYGESHRRSPSIAIEQKSTSGAANLGEVGRHDAPAQFGAALLLHHE
jgi:hypothetical protein